VVRKEYFGALVFDRQRGEYIPFDQDAVLLFEAASQRPMEEIFENVKDRLNRASFDTFHQLCRSIDLIDENGRLNGTFVADRRHPNMLSAPLRVHLAITNECGMRCRHCYLDTRDPLPNELSFAEIQKILDEMADMGACQLHIGGGEPFLRADLPRIVAHARARGLVVSLSTTATAVNRAVAKKMADLGLKSLRVSFDGGAEKSYDYHRNVKGAYRKAVRGIKTLREVFDKTPITMHTTLMKSNSSELLALAKLVQKMRLDVWSVDFVKPVGYASEAPQVWLSREEGEDIYRRITKMMETHPVTLKMAHFPYKGPRQQPVMGYYCLGANLFAQISPTGSVAPCSYTCRPFPAGNVRRKPLQEIWVTSDIIRKFRGSVSGPTACGFCMKTVANSVDPKAYEKGAFVMPTASDEALQTAATTAS